MAIAKLTDKIWWSNMHGPVEAKGQYKAILDLTGYGVHDNSHYRLSQIDEKAALFRLYAVEDWAVTEEFMHVLAGLQIVLDLGRLYPLLVHCIAGQCRSPAVAAFLAWRREMTTTHLEQTLQRMRELAPLNGGVDERRLFHRSIQDFMRATCVG